MSEEDAGEMGNQAVNDLEDVHEISEHALAELSTGDLNGLENSLRAINDRTSEWVEN